MTRERRTLHLEGISAGFGDIDVLHDVSFTVGPAELVTVFGPSGSGKTTLLRVLAGLHPASSGRILSGTHDITARPANHRSIGLVPQEGALFPHLTVAANVAYGLRRPHLWSGRRTRLHADRVTELLDLIGLRTRGSAMPHELSGGQQQRVALARALAPAPDVLLLDEPFSSLDPGLRTQLRHDTVRLLRATRTPAVLITHDLSEALSLSDRLVVLSDGHVIATGTPRELYEQPPTERVARLLGDSQLLAVTREGACVRTALGLHQTRSGSERSLPASVLARPEQVRLDSADDSHGGDDGALAEVCGVDYHGDTQRVRIRLTGDGAGVELVAQVSTARVWQTGDTCRARLVGPVHLLPDSGMLST